MEVKEVQAKAKQLELEIFQKLIKFEEETEVQITNLSVDRITYQLVGEEIKSRLKGVSIEIKL